MFAKKYPFVTPKEQLLSIGYAAASAGLLALGLSQILTPFGMALMGWGAAVSVTKILSLKVPFIARQIVKKSIAKGKYLPLAEDEQVCRIAKELSKSYGLPEVEIYTTKISKDPDVSAKFFGALVGTNVILTTEEALNEGYTDRQLRFILAHEMSHLKADYGSVARLSLPIMKLLPMSLLYLSGLQLVASALLGPAGAIIATLQSPLMSLGIYFTASLAAQLVSSAGSRMIERRADRNALYITRDIKGAEDVIGAMHEDQSPRPVIAEVLGSHPGFVKRMGALKKSFNMVSQYPSPSSPQKGNVAKPVSSLHS